MKSKRSKACDISATTKKKVWERDKQRCIICWNNNAMPVCHYIARSQGGLGIEKNIVTLCQQCHYTYDQTNKRQEYKIFIENYLKSKYNNWSEDELIYKK